MVPLLLSFAVLVVDEQLRRSGIWASCGKPAKDQKHKNGVPGTKLFSLGMFSLLFAALWT